METVSLFQVHRNSVIFSNHFLFTNFFFHYRLINNFARLLFIFGLSLRKITNCMKHIFDTLFQILEMRYECKVISKCKSETKIISNACIIQTIVYNNIDLFFFSFYNFCTRSQANNKHNSSQIHLPQIINIQCVFVATTFIRAKNILQLLKIMSLTNFIADMKTSELFCRRNFMLHFQDYSKHFVCVCFVCRCV